MGPEDDGSVRTLKKKYRLVRKLGQGGMGAVYLSHHELLDQPVAVKVMSPMMLESPAALERFLREARALASVHHPGLCRIFDVDTTDDGLPFIVMEFIDGETLDAALRDRPATAVRERVRWVVEASEALAIAHDQHIIHRDVKPANIMLTRAGAIRVVDFGVARRKEDDARMLTGDAMIGTINYLSPEQIQGEPVDLRSDVWAMAVTLYQLLSAQFPFDGDSLGQYLTAVVQGAPATLAQRGVEAPAGLWSAIERALRPKATRTPSLRAFADELRVFATADASVLPTEPAGGGVLVRPAPGGVVTTRLKAPAPPRGDQTAQSIDKAIPRSRAPVVVVALGLLVLLVGSVLMHQRAVAEPGAAGTPSMAPAAPPPATMLQPAMPPPTVVAPPTEPVEAKEPEPMLDVVAPRPKPSRVVPRTKVRPVDKNPDHL